MEYLGSLKEGMSLSRPAAIDGLDQRTNWPQTQTEHSDSKLDRFPVGQKTRTVLAKLLTKEDYSSSYIVYCADKPKVIV